MPSPSGTAYALRWAAMSLRFIHRPFFLLKRQIDGGFQGAYPPWRRLMQSPKRTLHPTKIYASETSLVSSVVS